MAAWLDTFKERLLKLITKFDADQHHYLSKDYLEAEATQGGLRPLPPGQVLLRGALAGNLRGAYTRT